MKLLYSLLILVTASFFSCNTKQQSTFSNVLNEAQLPSQLFSVNINSDTTLVTTSGAIIKIPKGSLQSDSSNVKLEIKEALTNEDIVLAGLTTMSGQQSLSSGGMIYFNGASGYKVEIKKAIEVAIPTKNYNRDMKVFKGEKDAAGKIDWKYPVPLPADETTKKLDTGKAIFMNNCASCHKIDKDFVGPALYGITYRKSKEWLYQYTNHNFYLPERKPKTTVVSPVESDFNISRADSLKRLEDSHTSYEELYYYHECQKRKFGGAEMPGFDLSEKDIQNLYTYIKNESNKKPDLKNKFKNNCCDSCVAYFKARAKLEDLQKEREDLVKENGTFFSLEREIPVPPPTELPTAPEPQTPVGGSTKVIPVTNAAVYYTINITAVGWYNIDILMKDYSNCVPSELMVRIQGNYKINFNVTLIIPSVKAFVEGGNLKNEKEYGFDENDGRIPLPTGAKCFVLAFAEQGDKVLFGKAEFNAQTKQSISIEVSETNKAAFKTVITQMGLDNVDAELKDSKNADQIRQADKQILELEKLKPKNCNCDFKSDTAAPAPAK
jgi:mono/diheme cytochrome c family protein